MRSFFVIYLFITLSGCSSYGSIENERLQYNTDVTELYSFGGNFQKREAGEYTVVVAMSGGGTRAAALSYGVLKGLKETQINLDNSDDTLLEEVDIMSAVSGGSFTAAYYGLYGDKIFTDFEKDFLYNDVGSDLFWRILNPRRWFSSSGRTEETMAYYQNQLFNNATFADFDPLNSPLVIINATDLSQGVRFSFTQEYFNLLCADISSYPIASAVTASSAVPIMFNPVVLENHSGCGNQALFNLNSQDETNHFTVSLIEGLNNYSNKNDKKYVHLVDGGLADNLGLLAIYDIMNLSDKRYVNRIRSKVKPHLIAISIDASASPTSSMDHSTKEPSLSETIGFMTDVQVHRLNEVSKALYLSELKKLETKRNVTTYFVNINLNNTDDPEFKKYLNNIPTDLELEAEQVDILIAEGVKQLKNHPEIARFLNNIDSK
ncbi:patatin-like phospholipase family protein [Vibrio sp. SG41-7]|uniref:patatin-like phospholipase family protein n=1 Tax=Vibrio sp. SG41-7 TaxID=2760973 RepID=UPI0016040ED2|nr:patatin-like phospholipase family protein [Vibrio sp. SG41-7]MBB1465445.1 patatin-like phospholipase family protein [Vibrio sp. SG41-7]